MVQYKAMVHWRRCSAGMILGGILGKGVTGKDNGAVAGAVLGGVTLADNKKTKQVITGYLTQRQ